MDAVARRVEQRLSDVRDVSVNWESSEQVRADLVEWLASQRNMLEQVARQPEKLQPEAAQLDLLQLQEARDVIVGKEETLDKLQERFARLSPNPDSTLGRDEVEPLRECWNALLNDTEALLEKKRQERTPCLFTRKN